MDYLKNYINGTYCDAASGTWIDNYNPSDGSVYAQIPDSNKQDVANAYTAAQDAFPEWSNTTIETRSKILLKIEKNRSFNPDLGLGIRRNSR